MSEEKLFRTIIHALRHDPWKYGLELDAEGYVAFDDLVTGLRFDRYAWALLESAEVERVVRTFGEGRFDFPDGRIRATYGHSFELGSLPAQEEPPKLLFHGTTDEALPLIHQQGLNPLGRQFVHLTSDRDYAVRVAAAKGGSAILVIDAAQASAAGASFRRANEHVWLVEKVEPVFLSPSPHP